jgi:hypothetical protein
MDSFVKDEKSNSSKLPPTKKRKTSSEIRNSVTSDDFDEDTEIFDAEAAVQAKRKARESYNKKGASSAETTEQLVRISKLYNH